jgi:hypothetical protein
MNAAVQTFLQSRAGRLGMTLLRWGVPALLLYYIGRRLTQIGWSQVWAVRPAHAGFYALLVLQYFLQPFGDYFVYRNLWGRQNTPPMAVILRKRFLNTFMLDYSGEVFFFLWAQKRLKLPALAMLWALACFLLLNGGLALPHRTGFQTWIGWIVGITPFLLCAALIVGRRRLTILKARQIGETFGIHALRCVAVLGCEFGLWLLSGALPTAMACIQFVALRLVITRLPLVSNKDLILVGAGIAAAGLAHAAIAPVAAVLVILAAADLVIGCVAVGLPWAFDHFRPSTEETA